jgi:hypothetical protein
MTYRDVATGALANPGSVTLKVRKPDGTLLSPAVTPTNPSVGVWVGLIPTDQEGTWYARFVTTSPNKVDTVTFDVKLDPDF